MLQEIFTGILKTQSELFLLLEFLCTRLELPKWEKPLGNVGIQYATLCGNMFESWVVFIGCPFSFALSLVVSPKLKL